MEPAGRAAAHVGVNYNTVLRYYSLLRKGIAVEREQKLVSDFAVREVQLDEIYFGRARGMDGVPDRTVPVFALSRWGDNVDIIFAERVTDHSLAAECYVYYMPDSWIFPESYPDCNDLGCVCSSSTGSSPVQSVLGNRFKVCSSDAFYPFVIRHLMEYCGGFKKNFRHFIREIEFRYNHRKDNDLLPRLYDLLKLGKSGLA